MFLTPVEIDVLKKKLISYEDQVDLTPLGEEPQATVDVPLTARDLIGMVDILNHILVLMEIERISLMELGGHHDAN